MDMQTKPALRSGVEPDSPAAWLRLAAAVLLSTVGGVGLWSVVVALPAVQQDFGVARAAASLPYAVTMLGFAAGGVATGRFADRFGILLPALFGTVMLSLGYVLAGSASGLGQFIIAHGVLIGAGSSVTFGPLMADLSHWFVRRRGVAVALVATGNYFAGVLWPPVVQHFIATIGWRHTHVLIGIVCAATMPPLLLLLRRRMVSRPMGGFAVVAPARQPLGLSPNALQVLLCVAGVGCCVAMAMPQVHLVAYCGDLGYGVARGAEMLSVMLGFGIFSRIGSGLIADRIGSLPTLLIGSALQGFALLLYLMFNGLVSLYVISALFGLFQGGIVPMYAMIVREFLPPRQAGVRLGLVLMATLTGMALGGWMSGWIFDWTGSYRAAFANGLAWNAVNLLIVGALLIRERITADAPRMA
jgi:MFS family permease